jgi:hypothetical protein
MTATLLDILMPEKDKRINFLLVLACSSTVIAVLAWYLFQYSPA